MMLNIKLRSMHSRAGFGMLSHLGKLSVQSGYRAFWRMFLRDFGLGLQLLQ